MGKTFDGTLSSCQEEEEGRPMIVSLIVGVAPFLLPFKRCLGKAKGVFFCGCGRRERSCAELVFGRNDVWFGMVTCSLFRGVLVLGGQSREQDGRTRNTKIETGNKSIVWCAVQERCIVDTGVFTGFSSSFSFHNYGLGSSLRCIFF